MSRIAIFAAVYTALLLGLTNRSTGQQIDKMNADTTALVKGDNTFAFDLYHKLSTNDGNLFFSPYSISNALAMTYAGARGQTAFEMAQTLRFPFDDQRLPSAFADLIQQLNRPGQKRQYQLVVANRLWGQKEYGFLPEFLKVSQDAYGAGLGEVDFATASEQARQVINAWVAKETQDRIKDLLAAGSVNTETRLVLTNAIYFKARWALPFNDKQTTKDDFHVRAGKTVKVDMMHRGEMMNLLETDTFQMLELPYEQRELSMLVFLPRKVDGLNELEKQASAGNLEQWRGKVKRYQVTLSMPKFTFSSEFMLKNVLSTMGMGSAFTKAADFSGMTTREKLFINAVVHKAFVAVDEKGTEAAAATGVTVGATAQPVAPQATFRADHPFLFVVRDNKTGSLLFMGRVVNL
jgi:serine protease inhibitor